MANSVTFICKRTSYRARQEQIGKIASIESRELPKPRIRSLQMSVKSARCTAQRHGLDYKIQKGPPPVTLVVHFKHKEESKKTPTVLDRTHFIGKELTLTAFQAPIMLSKK